MNTDELLANLSTIAEHLGCPLQDSARLALSRLLTAGSAVPEQAVIRARRAMLWAVLAARQAGEPSVDGPTLQRAAIESDLCFTPLRFDPPRQRWTRTFRDADRSEHQASNRSDESARTRARDRRIEDGLASN